MWNPEHYLAFADERGRPFVDLLAWVDAERPERVADLGCGPGNLTRRLTHRWPSAQVVGVDSSPEMIDRARQGHPDDERLTFEIGDLRRWRPESRYDVVISNAALQWVPEHRELLTGLVETLAPGGWLAFQVPANSSEPSHTLRRDLAAEPPYARHAEGVDTPSCHAPEEYLATLFAAGCDHVDVWETTYLHVLTGPDPVFDWVVGTGARPTLEALPAELRAGFEVEFKRRLRTAYPAGPHGVVLPFRRIFAVARRPR